MELEGLIEETPDLTFTNTGKNVCNFKVEGIRCIAWSDLANKISTYILPGDKVKVYGTEKERWWTNPEGEKLHVKEVTVNRIQVLERPKPIEYCCYYCSHFNVDCLKQCFSAMGGRGYIQVCQVIDGRCRDLDNSECWESNSK